MLRLCELCEYGLIICEHLFFDVKKFVDLRGHLLDLEHLAADRVLLVEFVAELGQLAHDLKELRLRLRVLEGQGLQLLTLLLELTVEREGVTVDRGDQNIVIGFS